MHCEQARKLMDAHLDDELDAGTSTELAAHLRECPACAARRDERAALRAALRRLPVHQAPDGLREAIVARLVAAAARDARVADEADAARDASAAARTSAAEAAPRRPARRRTDLAWWQAGALAAFAAVIAFVLGLRWAGPAPEPDMRAEVAAHHAAWLADGKGDTQVVASADRHTVKPWFAGKLDFTPPVRDLDALGFTLVGGRLDRLRATRAAVVTYRIRDQMIDLFVWRGADLQATAPVTLSRRGFALVEWAEDDLRFAAVSDVDAVELQRFVAAVRAGPVQ